jgi:catechol-2,3-dioxygenase
MSESRKARMIGVNHVVLEVGDLDAALAFYGRIFDLRLRARSDTNAFVDMGDQFIQFSLGKAQGPDDKRHFGLVVDDREPVRRALAEMGVELITRMNFRDPWGNRIEVVGYEDIQFTKAPHVLRGMGLDDLGKSTEARRQLAEKGMADAAD